MISERVDARSAREGVTHHCITDDSQTLSGNRCETCCSRIVLVTHLLFGAIFFTHTSFSLPFFGAVRRLQHNSVSQISIYACCESAILRIFAFWHQRLADSQK
jgi:hypothetical protein